MPASAASTPGGGALRASWTQCGNVWLARTSRSASATCSSGAGCDQPRCATAIRSPSRPTSTIPAQPSPRPLPPRWTKRGPPTRRSTKRSAAPTESAAEPGPAGVMVTVWSEEGRRLARAADVRATELGDDASARCPLQEPQLEQVRLVDVLDRLRLLAERDREIRQADGPAAEP